RLRATAIAAALDRKFAAVRRFDGHTAGVTYLALSPDGKQVVSCSQFDDCPRVCDVGTGQVLLKLEDHKRLVAGVAWRRDGKRVLTASFDGGVRLVEVETGKLVRKMDGTHPGGAWFVAASPDGKRAASVGGDKRVKLHELATGKLLKDLSGHTEPTHAIAYS